MSGLFVQAMPMLIAAIRGVAALTSSSAFLAAAGLDGVMGLAHRIEGDLGLRDGAEMGDVYEVSADTRSGSAAL